MDILGPLPDRKVKCEKRERKGDRTVEDGERERLRVEDREKGRLWVGKGEGLRVGKGGKS